MMYDSVFAQALANEDSQKKEDDAIYARTIELLDKHPWKILPDFERETSNFTSIQFERDELA